MRKPSRNANGYQHVEADLPTVISIIKSSTDPRLPSLRGMMKAKRAEIPHFTVQDLELPPAEVGLDGSPTKVVKIFTPIREHNGRIFEGEKEEIATELVSELRSAGLIN